MKQLLTTSCLLAYIITQVYAGYFSSDRHIEDIYNQLSHCFAMTAILLAIIIRDGFKSIMIINSVLAGGLIALNVAEFIDEARKLNDGEIQLHDYIFPVLILLTTPFIAWKQLSKKK